METSKKIEFFRLQRINLNVSGILPPLSCYGSRIKMSLYNMFSILIILLFIPAICEQIKVIIDYPDDMEFVTRVLFQLSCCFGTWFMFSYFVMKRSQMVELMESLERDFVPHIEKAGSDKRDMYVNAQRGSDKITYLLMALNVIVQLQWCFIPFVLGYIEYIARPDFVADQNRYFAVATWLPDNVNKSPTYEMMQFNQFIICYIVVNNMASCYMIMFAFSYHITTLLKILCASLENVTDKSHEQSFIYQNETMPRKGSDVPPSPILSSLEESTSSGNLLQNGLSYERCKPISQENQKQNMAEVESSQYCYTTENNLLLGEELTEKKLIACIEFHSSIIEYTDRVNDLLGPPMLIFFIFGEFTMCLSAFRCALGGERVFQFLSSLLLCSISALLVCWFGDQMQSLAVKQAAFNSGWYRESKAFNKKLLMTMMMAQKPQCLKTGFYNASLQTYSQIMHKVYASFMLLRQVFSE